MAAQHHCLEIFACPLEALRLPESERRKVFGGLTKTSPPGGFQPCELASRAPLSLFEEASVILVLAIVMGGPLFLLPTLVYCMTRGWMACLAWMVAVLALALHPMPTHPMHGRQTEAEQALSSSSFTLSRRPAGTSAARRN